MLRPRVLRVLCDLIKSVYEVFTLMYNNRQNPQPKADPPREKIPGIISGVGATFSHSKYFFVGWD